MKRLIKLVSYIILLVLIVSVFSFDVDAANDKYTRQGDTVWLGMYPQTKATDEELAKMSKEANSDGYFTSGKDLFVKVSDADPKVHYETADTTYIPFDDGTAPVPGETYYFKVEPIEWKVLIDDGANDTVKLVSKKYIDTYFWLRQYAKDDTWYGYYNTMEGVPEKTPAYNWQYSEMRAYLNDNFYNTAFKDVKEHIQLFANSHIAESNSVNVVTVNDYVAVGDRSDYDSAGDDGRPTDYTIVKGATWCYNKDHIYYYVNDYFPGGFSYDTLTTYRHDEHNKATRAENIEAIRPIIYAKRSTVKVLATEAKKEANAKSLLLIIGIIAAIAGGVLAIPVMISTSKKQKKEKAETGNDYRLKKSEVARIAPGLVSLIGGCVCIALFIVFSGGIGGTKLKPGIYLQTEQFGPSGGTVQVGYMAFRLNSDGTYDFTDSYEGDKTPWSAHGTYSISGSTVYFKMNPNPLYPNGTTQIGTIKSRDSFGDGTVTFKRIT